MLSPVMRCFYFSYHYKLPFDVYSYTFDICTSKVYFLTYLDYCVCSNALKVLLYSQLPLMLLAAVNKLASHLISSTSSRAQLLSQSQMIRSQSQVDNRSHNLGQSPWCMMYVECNLPHFVWYSAVVLQEWLFVTSETALYLVRCC